MNIITQTFSLMKKGSSYADAKEEQQKGYDEILGGLDYDEYKGALTNKEKRELNKLDKNTTQAKESLAKSAMAEGIAVASFVYNYAAKTTRFGLRGQDIQDQLKVQDKLVNKAFGIGAVAVASGGNWAAIGISVIASVFSEAISVIIQNKQYEYNKEIDQQQKAISQERIGRAVYNSSRR